VRGTQIARPTPRKGIALPPPRTGGSGHGTSQRGATVTRRTYDAFSGGDVEILRQVFADTAVFHEPGHNPVSGDYQGIDQVLALFGKLAERSGGTFRVTVHDAVANDEHAMGLHVAGRAGGAPSAQPTDSCASSAGWEDHRGLGASLRPACNR
jgi:ketosteroid isomerase-like protein